MPSAAAELTEESAAEGPSCTAPATAAGEWLLTNRSSDSVSTWRTAKITSETGERAAVFSYITDCSYPPVCAQPLSALAGGVPAVCQNLDVKRCCIHTGELGLRDSRVTANLDSTLTLIPTLAFLSYQL